MTNIQSLAETVSLVQRLRLRSFRIERLLLLEDERGSVQYVEFVGVDAIDDWIEAATAFIASSQGLSGARVVRVEDLNLVIENLSQYQAGFEVSDVSTAPSFRESRVRNVDRQGQIDKEVERYKRLVQGLIEGYNSTIDDIVGLIPPLTETSYVEPFYVDPGFVEPQTN